MRIIVTGGCGLIGSRVVAILESLGHEVEIVDNFTNYGFIDPGELEYLHSERLKNLSAPIHRICITNSALQQVFSWFKPEIVIHLASYPRQKAVSFDPATAADVMCRGLTNVLECSRTTGVKKFVFLSSSMVYGDFKDYVVEDYNCKPQGLYGIFKLAGEAVIKDYERKWGLQYTIIRPSAVYGETDVSDRVVAKFIISAMLGQTLKVNGASETLDFTYVGDAAAGIVDAALSGNTANKTYNITKSHSTSLLEAAQLAVKIVGSGSIHCAVKDEDFPSRGALDISAARRDFNYNPLVDVEEGFVRYYRWLCSSPYWRKKLNK